MIESSIRICYLYLKAIFNLVKFQRIWRINYYQKKYIKIKDLRKREMGYKINLNKYQISPCFKYRYRLGYELFPDTF